jgi:hypothetical protein
MTTIRYAATAIIVGLFAFTAVAGARRDAVEQGASTARAADRIAITAAPTITGIPQAGLQLTGVPGTFSGQVTRTSYKWLRCSDRINFFNCATISGASGTTYLLTAADFGSALRFAVTAAKGRGFTTATSAATDIVTAPPASNPPASDASTPPPPATTTPPPATTTPPPATTTPPPATTTPASTPPPPATTPPPASTPAPAVGAGARLGWAPPVLSSPVTVVVSNSAPVVLNLDANKDYILKLGHLSGPGGLTVNGGHNVVIVGGQITAAPDGVESHGWAMRFYDQTGTVHIEGVLIDSSNDGITIQAPLATFQIENVRVANNHALRDDFSSAHPDLIQTWSGPKVVRIDRFTGYTDYQGFTWMNAGDAYVYPGTVTATNVNIRALAPQPSTVARWPDGSTRDKPDLAAAVWHVSRATTFSCSSCFTETGWYDQGYQRKLDDSIGGFMNSDGSYSDPYYEFHGSDGASYLSPSSPTGGVGNSTTPTNLGRRQGDTISWPTTSQLANEKWTAGAPSGGDFVPDNVPGVNYSSPGYN